MGSLTDLAKDRVSGNASPTVQLKSLVDKKSSVITDLLGGNVQKFEKFKSNLVRLYSSSYNLDKCSPLSVLGAAMQSAYLNLDLDPNMGQAYVMARWNKNLNGKGSGGFEASFQTGYQGLTELIRRSGKLKAFNVNVVYENEPFNLEYGIDGVTFKHQPLTPSKRGNNRIGVYMVSQLTDGGSHFEFMWAEEVMAVKAISTSKDSAFSPWNANPIAEEGMWKKTVIRRASKYLPKSVELANVIGLENASESGFIDYSAVVEGGEPTISKEDEVNVEKINLKEKVVTVEAQPSNNNADSFRQTQQQQTQSNQQVKQAFKPQQTQQQQTQQKPQNSFQEPIEEYEEYPFEEEMISFNANNIPSNNQNEKQNTKIIDPFNKANNSQQNSLF